LFERSEFSPTPLDASSARHCAAARASARLFFAYFLLAKQKKVRRRRGATRHATGANQAVSEAYNLPNVNPPESNE
jgi:hypothetical protein